jgi:hypothetical protein
MPSSSGVAAHAGDGGEGTGFWGLTSLAAIR